MRVVRAVDLSPDVDLGAVARSVPGFSGAELANLVDQAVLCASRRVSGTVAQADFDAALDRVSAGIERPLSAEERGSPAVRRIAAYEMGKAFVAHLMCLKTGRGEKVDKVSIAPRPNEVSRTRFAAREEGDPDAALDFATKARPQ